ncbi:unnamed protein product [Protopolystoma xenopodis]|uniref:Dendritic cell-specific transmembrane protein-like domain-containing protein n=1 Tax=Protopolystoma xenopodis TaxID=117903 RepID=A0A3S5CIJ8_9PLAT|nr:unnamed protein product [Protopolystoma xenopodis]
MPKYVGSRVSCSARADVDVTKKECSMAPEFSGHQGGVVSRLMLMKDRLQMMSNLSHLKTGVRQISELSKPVFTLAGTVVQSTSNLVATTRSFFRSAQAVIALLASLLKLIILMVLFKANAYITGYLHDSDFDNIYVDDYFEQLDWRRVRQGREGLLPLHRVENKRFIWHTKRYTKSEFKKACMALLKASLLVTSVMLILMGNKYIYDLMIILDKSADISVNLETGTSQQRELTSPKTSGDGLLVKLFTNIISKVMRLSQVRLDYGLSSCRPRTHRLPPEVVFRIMLLSLVILILGGISGYLLRLRHHILDFFYPARFRRRTLYLYNAMLVDRKRRETVAKNVLLQRIRQNLLQAVVVDQFVRKKKLIESQMTSMIKVKQTKWIKKWLLNRKSLKCLVCQETFPVGSNLLRVCPVDGSVICKVCQRNLLLSDDTSDCISCADQDLSKMIALARKLEPEYHDEDKDNLNFRKKEVKQKH